MSAAGTAGAPSVVDLRFVRGAVLGYGRAGLRPLPWRATRDAWAVMVSEVMLQQTQAARVAEPWARFMARFATPARCAAATPGDVVVAWAGLGYNRRAGALHRAAGAVVEHHGGVVPSGVDALVALPGIGPYTARAVAVFAYERHHAVVDVNVTRVLARAVAGTSLSPAAAQRLAGGLVPRGRSWEWNQALMELGALLCTARAPACAACPLAPRCAWRRAGAPSPDPGHRARAPSPFEGSDRQGRGRLVAALRVGPVAPGAVAAACGWPRDPARARRVAAGVVADGLARRGRGGVLRLP